MTSIAFAAAGDGRAVLVTETGVERLQLVGRVGPSTFLLGGTRNGGGMTSGPNPYDLLAASLASCTAMTMRMFADLKGLPMKRVQVGVSHHRGSAGARDRFDRLIVIEGELDATQRARLLKVANGCPVGMSLGRSADMNTVLSPAGDGAPMSPTASEYMRDMLAVADAEEVDLRHALTDLGNDD